MTGAERMLALSCTEIEALGAGGKADGAFCDWFGTGCSSDEDIFHGAACSFDSDCASGSSCIEEHCFAGVDSWEFTSILDELTGTTETFGSDVHLLADVSDTRALWQSLIAHRRNKPGFREMSGTPRGGLMRSERFGARSPCFLVA